MAKPAILAVDDDVAVVGAVVRDLRQRYGEDYRVLRATSGPEALEILADQLLKDRPIAAVVSDQRMPGMTGIEVLQQVREQSPDTKLLLLTAYADTDVAIRAINDIALDYYLMKPWDPPEDRLYPVLDELLRDWAHGHPDRDSEVRVVGHRWSDRTHEVKTFLTHNHVPYRWLEVDADGAGDEATRLLELAGAGVDDLPVVALPDGSALRSPTTIELADALGLSTRATKPLYDLCVVGAGPAGLAAAVYAASEGLQVVVVERDAPGGQAGQSASIENYLGFPKGLSGADLTHRAVAQASRFGAEMVLARDVVGFETRGPVRAVLLDGSADIEARAVLVASGVSYRRLDAPGLDDFVGRGIYYGASASEATQTVGEDVYVVGAANSAGQAVLNFAKLRRARSCSSCAAPRSRRRCRSTSSTRILDHAQRRGPAADRDRRHPRRRPPRGHHAVRPGGRQRRRRRHQLGVHLHRRGPAHRLARRRRSPATSAASCSPAPTCRASTCRGRWSAARSRWRPACPASSPRATYAVTR